MQYMHSMLKEPKGPRSNAGNDSGFYLPSIRDYSTPKKAKGFLLYDPGLL